MDANKKIIEEMRKYNKELERHIPGLDDSSLNSNSVFKTDNDQDEVFTLFAQNLLDLRTEMNLIRKNLSTDIEGMVTRVVNEQQRKFNSRMDNFFVKAILDVKENWSTQLGVLSKEINEIKRGFSNVKTESSNLEDSIRDLKEQFMLLKSVITQIASKDDSQILIPQIKALENKVEELKNEIDNDYNNNSMLEQKVSKLSNSYKALLLKFNDVKIQTDNIDTTVSELKGKSSKNIKKNIDDEFNSKFGGLENSYDQLLSELSSLKDMAVHTKDSPSLVDIEKNISKKLDNNNVELIKNNEDIITKVQKSPSDKLIDIESKISKLSSYK